MTTNRIVSLPSLYSVDYGRDGVPILLLHGLGGGGSTWDSVAKSLSPRRVLVPDLLGFGRSPRPDSAYSIDDHLAALFRLVEAKEMDNGKLVVAGHSMGAILAAAFAGSYPDLVRGIVLAGLPVYQSREQARETSEGLGLLARSILREERLPRLMCHIMCAMRPAFVAIAPVLQPTLPASVARDAFRHDPTSFFKSFENVVLSGRLGEILDEISQRSVLIIHGELDKIAPFPLIQRLPQKYPGWQFRFIKDGGHLLPIKRPELIAEMLRDPH